MQIVKLMIKCYARKLFVISAKLDTAIPWIIKKTMKKSAYFTDAQWTTYTNAWKLPENIKVSDRCLEKSKTRAGDGLWNTL